MAQIPTGLVSHSRKVCSLYKRSVRMLESYHMKRDIFRYEAVLLRHRFDENRNIPDARLAKVLLLEGEEELFQRSHWCPKVFPESPTGIAFQRYGYTADFVLDYWEPIEKARYPKYFAKREELKKEYVKLFKKLYPDSSDKKSSDATSKTK